MKHIILQTNEGYFYKLPLNKFEEFKMPDAEIEKFISEEQESINLKDEELIKNIMWTAASNMDRMVPMVSSMVRMVPGGLFKPWGFRSLAMQVNLKSITRF